MRCFRDASGPSVDGHVVDSNNRVFWASFRACGLRVEAGAGNGFFFAEFFQTALGHGLGIGAHAGTNVGTYVLDNACGSFVGKFPDRVNLEVCDPPCRVASRLCIALNLFFSDGGFLGKPVFKRPKGFCFSSTSFVSFRTVGRRELFHPKRSLSRRRRHGDKRQDRADDGRETQDTDTGPHRSTSIAGPGRVYPALDPSDSRKLRPSEILRRASELLPRRYISTPR